MVRAAVLGAVDFSRADPRDRRWWLQVRLVIDELEDQAHRDLVRMYHDTAARLLSRPDLTPESLDRLREGTSRLADDYRRRLLPWEAGGAEAFEDTATRLRKGWIDAFGDPEDPEVQRAIARTVKHLESQTVNRPRR